MKFKKNIFMALFLTMYKRTAILMLDGESLCIL